MKNFKIKLGKFRLRIKVIFNILFGRQKGWMFITIPDNETLLSIIKEEKGYDLNMVYEGLRPYLIKLIMNDIGNSVDQADLDLMRAQFQGEAELYNKD